MEWNKEYFRGVHNYRNATPTLSLSERPKEVISVASEIAQHHASNMHIQLNKALVSRAKPFKPMAIKTRYVYQTILRLQDSVPPTHIN